MIWPIMNVRVCLKFLVVAVAYLMLSLEFGSMFELKLIYSIQLGLPHPLVEKTLKGSDTKDPVVT